MNRRDRQFQIMTLLGHCMDREHSLVNSRLTWLMTLDGFLIAAFGLVVTNVDKLSDGRAFIAVVTSISILGTLCNASVLYSNYWASRAMKEADEAARWALDSSRIDADGLEHPSYLFRLFGRDPRELDVDGPQLSQPWHPVTPPQKILHPWYLLPLLFCVTFVILPFSSRSAIIHGHSYILPVVAASLPLAFLFLAILLFLGERNSERLRR